jgi:hypothetical protein
VHNSWLYQIESFFSIVQRTVLTPTDHDLAEADRWLMQFQYRGERIAEPFERRFGRADLAKRMTGGTDPHRGSAKFGYISELPEPDHQVEVVQGVE